MVRSGSKKFIVMTVLSIFALFTAFYRISDLQDNNVRTKSPDKRNKVEQVKFENTAKSKVLPSKNAEKKSQVGRKSIEVPKVKAIFITGTTAGSSQALDKIVSLVKRTELNSVVLDVKDDFGKVNYKSNISEVRKMGAYHTLYNVESVLKKLHDNGIYVIGRIVTFKDPMLSTKRADLAIKRPGGQIWRENGITSWANPFNETVWDYNLRIAEEAVDLGFDEIQFDYVRYPAARKSEVYYGNQKLQKAEAISAFLKQAQERIHDKKGVVVSADVFGIICESPGDVEDIGQSLELIGKNIGYISPMVYPSHYANVSQNGAGQKINGVSFKAPDLRPYDVVYNTLVKAKDRISKVQGYNAKVRPYLQDFTASWLRGGYYQKYGPEQVRQQIKAVYDAGYDEWILWDPMNTYTEGALLKEK